MLLVIHTTTARGQRLHLKFNLRFSTTADTFALTTAFYLLEVLNTWAHW